MRHGKFKTFVEMGPPETGADAPHFNNAADAAQHILRKAGFGGPTPYLKYREPPPPPGGAYAPVQVEPPVPEPEAPAPRRKRNKPDDSYFARVERTASPRFRAGYNKYDATPEDIDKILQLARQGETPHAISLRLGDHHGKLVPIHVVTSVLDQHGVKHSQVPDAHDDTEYWGGAPEDYALRDRAKWDRPIDLDQEMPDFYGPPKMKDMVRSMTPPKWEVDRFVPEKGQFGHGVKTPDFYDQASRTTRGSYKAKYNQYEPSPEEAEMIMGLARKGLSPLGISLELGDRLGKTIPAHKIQKLMAQGGVQHQPDPSLSIKQLRKDSLAEMPPAPRDVSKVDPRIRKGPKPQEGL